MTSIQVISIGIRWNFDGIFFSNIDRTWNDEICDSIHSQFWLESTYLNISQLHPRDMWRDCLELRRIANACDSVDFLVPLLTTWAGGPVPLFVGFRWSMNHPPTTKPKKQTKWIVCKGIRSVLFQPCFFFIVIWCLLWNPDWYPTTIYWCFCIKCSNCNKSSTTTFAGSEIQPSEYAHPLYHDLKFEYITEN